jgi:hypothetical protein
LKKLPSDIVAGKIEKYERVLVVEASRVTLSIGR